MDYFHMSSDQLTLLICVFFFRGRNTTQFKKGTHLVRRKQKFLRLFSDDLEFPKLIIPILPSFCGNKQGGGAWVEMISLPGKATREGHQGDFRRVGRLRKAQIFNICCGPSVHDICNLKCIGVFNLRIGSVWLIWLNWNRCAMSIHSNLSLPFKTWFFHCLPENQSVRTKDDVKSRWRLFNLPFSWGFCGIFLRPGFEILGFLLRTRLQITRI